MASTLEESPIPNALPVFMRYSITSGYVVVWAAYMRGVFPFLSFAVIEQSAFTAVFITSRSLLFFRSSIRNVSPSIPKT